IRLRGFHSKSSSSTASSTAATGEANVADMPPAAPATSSVFRSALVSRKSCATIEPKAPPVMMMGPSAPNGPPLQIQIAAHRPHSRTDSAPRCDEGPPGAERPAAADPDRRRQRLQQRDPRLDPTAAEQDRLDRLRNAVTPDALGAVTRHEPDDERADDRNQDR